ncbi:MAG: glutamine-hydrolyzing GMP synthase [Candidatus Aminicenantes bacterium]|nr:glutamine-hydrolyzing GMP synthase [Candidatus Aminicenantes bacterium]
MRDKILILDFGSQYTQLIARSVRELGVFSEIRPYDFSLDRIREAPPAGIVLSGGPASITVAGAPRVDRDLFGLGIPILGICYGMQLITQTLGGRVERSTRREYGQAELLVGAVSPLFAKVKARSTVWMSHGDSLARTAPGYTVIARSSDGAVAAIENQKSRIFAVQFHPEVKHTQEGKKILANFLFTITGAARTWNMKNFVAEESERLREQCLGKRVVLGVSGGVDSTTLAVLLRRALGKNVTAIFVNNGLLRLNEEKEVLHNLRRRLGLNVTYIDASRRFLRNLKGVADPERKRKIIGKTFIDVFYQGLPDFDFLVQGTLYPDVIESNPVQGPSQTIKTHHNRVPEVRRLEKQGRIIEPFKFLFKDEVRAVARLLQIPADLFNRHPFPGPGLAVRILGDVTPAKLSILRSADDIFISELKRSGWYEKTWQAFAVLLPVRSVGVMGDERAYGQVIALRAVTSTDGMTANWAALPAEVLDAAANRIVRQVHQVTRVVYDITAKPPATIEWE